MKGRLEFNLPEERVDFERAQKADAIIAVLNEFYNESIRRRVKYESDAYTKEQIELLDTLKSELHATVDFHGLASVIWG